MAANNSRASKIFSFLIFLLIIGDGPIKQEIQGLLAKSGLVRRSKITGLIPHDNIPQYLNLCDITVSPKSTFYASPMKVLEYMSMAKTVVVPDQPNYLDIIDPGLNGEVFTDQDSDSLTEVLRLLCNDKIRRRKLGKNARRKVENRLNWNWNAQNVCTMVSMIKKQRTIISGNPEK